MFVQNNFQKNEIAAQCCENAKIENPSNIKKNITQFVWGLEANESLSDILNGVWVSA
jgi:hypothetical protein